MKDFLEQIVRTLVDHPDDVQIIAVEGKRTALFELRCNQEDVGKVIGKSGKTVGAIRTLLSALAGRDGRRAVLEVVD